MANNFVILNRRGKRYEWRIYKGSDVFFNSQDAKKARGPSYLGGLLAVPLSTGHINADVSQTHTFKESTLNYFFIGGDCVGPYLLHAGEKNVMAPGGAATAVVSVDGAVKSVMSGLNNQSPEKTTAGPDKVQKTIKMVAKTLIGLASGLLSAFASATPLATGKLALNSAAVTSNAMGSIMLMDFEDSNGEVPQGPTVTDIENALRFVVLNAEARNDASLFMSAYSGFQEKAMEIGALLPNRSKAGPDRWRQSSPIPNHLLNNLQDSVDRALAVESGDSFVNRLEYQCNNPESAWFILPQLMIAIGLYLHLKRLHIAMIYLPERVGRGALQIPPAVVVENLIDKIGNMKSGLLKARSSFEAYVDSKVGPTGLSSTPEAIAVIKAITKHYFGDENAVHHQGYKKTYPKGSDFLGMSIPDGQDQVDAAIAKLNQIAGYLSDDVALIKNGKWPQHLIDVKFDDDPASV